MPTRKKRRATRQRPRRKPDGGTCGVELGASHIITALAFFIVGVGASGDYQKDLAMREVRRNGCEFVRAEAPTVTEYLSGH